MSEHTGYSYEICIFKPDGEPPVGGYPVYYILDGSSYFQFARDVVRLQSRNAPKTFVDPAIVVGIGHQEADMRRRRFEDFTAPAHSYSYPDRLQNGNLGPHGGAERFLAFMEQELMPAIEARYPVCPHKRCLYGHSLAGYFAMWVKLTRSELFQAYLAASPSVWWNDHELLRYAERYAEERAAADRSDAIIAVGELEGFMVEDAQKLAAVLSACGRPVQLYAAPDENHGSVVPTTMSRMLRFGASVLQAGN